MQKQTYPVANPGRHLGHPLNGHDVTEIEKKARYYYFISNSGSHDPLESHETIIMNLFLVK